MMICSLYGDAAPEKEGLPSAWLVSGFEQGIGGQPMGRRAITMGFHPLYLSLKQADAIIQFIA